MVVTGVNGIELQSNTTQGAIPDMSGGAIKIMLVKKGKTIACWIIMILDDTIYLEPYQDRTTEFCT